MDYWPTNGWERPQWSNEATFAGHTPTGGTRRRVYPQRFLQDILNAFAISETPLDDGRMHDIGVFSRILQDVESVYLSIDSARRFREILNFLQNIASQGYDSATDDLLRRPDARQAR